MTEKFVQAIVDVARPQDDDSSLLEQSFKEHWPTAGDYLPAPGEEPIVRPAALFAPDPSRQNIFDGYSFVFYEQRQFDALLAVITNGKGKALLHHVTPNQSHIDDFIRYVKSVAGEKGLGEFEDGSEGKGVVVVRFIPSKGEDLSWYQEFAASVALRLDHRPIDQRDFLDAIVMKNASALRRPLESEPDNTPELTEPGPSETRRWLGRSSQAAPMETDKTGQPTLAHLPESTHQPEESSQVSLTLRRRGRRGLASRFKGFDDDDDDDAMDDIPAASAPTLQAADVSQTSNPEPVPEAELPLATTTRARRSQRRRPALSPPPPDPSQNCAAEQLPYQDRKHVMDDIAPTAAAVKRRRIEQGETPVPRQPIIEAPQPKVERGVSVEKEKEIDILDLARQNREEAEARALKEKQELAQLPEGLDLAAIRKLAVVEEVEVRKPQHAGGAQETGDDADDTMNGRWNPKWNGRRNFKAFRKQGFENGRTRARPRIIISLQEAESKAYGVGDDYWLENEPACPPTKRPATVTLQSRTQKSDSESQKQKAPPHSAGGWPVKDKAAVITTADDSGDSAMGDGPGRASDSSGGAEAIHDSLDEMTTEDKGDEGNRASFPRPNPTPPARSRVAKKAARSQMQRAAASKRSAVCQRTAEIDIQFTQLGNASSSVAPAAAATLGERSASSSSSSARVASRKRTAASEFNLGDRAKKARVTRRGAAAATISEDDSDNNSEGDGDDDVGNLKFKFRKRR